MTSLFVTDLHGNKSRYLKLFELIGRTLPVNVFLGGDLFPHQANAQRFLSEFLRPHFERLRADLGIKFPVIYVILGNDDPRAAEPVVLELERLGIWRYCHNKAVHEKDITIVGYSFVPPTPFLLKDWERYDVSHYVDPGCVSPEAGETSVEISERERKWSTIADDLDKLTSSFDPPNTIFLFHSPPYDTVLDRAALDGMSVEHVPLDVHVGSIAIRRFIEQRQPLLTLHGHIHESTRLTGEWRQKIGRTHCLNAAHDGPELCVIRFDLRELESAERFLI